DCTFSGNYAFIGGGMHNRSSNPTVTNCTFSGNYASSVGGGMYNVLECSPRVTDCTFSGNYASSGGGGMYNTISSPTVTDCTFSSNSTGSSGGGGMYNGSSSPTLGNCILWGNTATSADNEIYNVDSTPLISYCDIAGCGGSGGGWDTALGTDSGGNIDADPNFVRNPDPGPDGEWDGVDDDYGDLHLLLGSPCIDAGSNFYVPLDTIDLDNDGDMTELMPFDADGLSRFHDSIDTPDTGSHYLPDFPIVDMGLYEYHGRVSIPGDINGDGVVNMLDWAILAGHWLEDIR
ncbi:MAG: hypothetical protein GY869_31580, partial [Planctomycetes bacterium]|nr:hypothetical protein [Planctomycetota bacterium]